MAGSEDDEDDTHFCIKCHATMRGLDTYIAHRKAKCHPEVQVQAHDFFSSLNLQSSSKAVWPSPAHTGGKWRPADTEPSTAQNSQNERHNEIPPPGHTGGKWKPQDGHPVESEDQVPPPDHTRGKWGPAERPWGQLRKGLYWCGPCNRRLSSKVVYDRHIRSELHFKRTNQWPGSEPQSGRRTRVRTKAILSSSLKIINRRYTKDKEVVRKRKGGPLSCEACRCKVWPQLIGKHLVSHYHYRHRKSGCEAFILQNIESVVRQAPFQCGLCKFYTNTVKDFLDHWASDMHRQNDMKLEGTYWCGLCKCCCGDSVSMGYHLQSETHGEMVSVINRSVPIIIQKRVTLNCEVCSRGFRYNAELRCHAQAWKHKQTRSTASDSYQEVQACSECEYRCFSLLSYQRHIRMKHGKEIHFCRKCDKRFSTMEEVRKHRLEAKHRETGDCSLRKCIHCLLQFPGLSRLREHLTREHPDQRHRCPKCGSEFVLKQELSQHAKSGQCEPSSQSDGKHKCDKCPFATNSESELLLHNILHGQPSTDSEHYPCLYCGKAFKKDVLKNHVRTHTAEKAFVCSVCDASFRRRDALNKHIGRVHEARTRADPTCRLCPAQLSSASHLSRHMGLHQERSKDFVCHQCSTAFYDKASLEKHMQRHEGKKYPCTIEGCIFKGRSAAELRVHGRTHSSIREFQCSECQYAAKTRGQLAKHMKSVHAEARRLDCPHCDFTTKNRTHLRRHVNLHTGQKPYRCPHCTFSCTLLENLRKHVIYSKLHPGKMLYECRECEMKTNLSKELRAHLVAEHGTTPEAASRHVARLYRPQPEVATLVPVKANRRKKKVEGEVEGVEPLPTLASVALSSHEEDVIFIEVDEDLEGVLYQSADPSFHLEAYQPDRV